MTYPGEQPPTAPAQPQQAGPYQPAGPPPPRRRAWLPWTIAGLAVLALAVGAVVFLLGRAGGGSSGLSREVAQRECRTALEDEASQRARGLGGEGDGIVVTVKSTDVNDTYESDGGWTVNGTVAYTLTSTVVAPIEQSVALTCSATGTDDAVKTAVKNRS